MKIEKTKIIGATTMRSRYESIQILLDDTYILTTLNEQLQLNPDDVSLLIKRGVVYFFIHEYNLAIDDLSNAINLNPDCAEAFYYRSYIYDELKIYDKAIEDYTAMLMLNSGNTEVLNNRGLIYDKLEAYDKAIEDYTAAIKLDPQYAQAYNNRGNTYSNIKIFDKAIEDYNAAIMLNQNNAEVFYNRGNAYSKWEVYDKAIEDYTTAIGINPGYAEFFYNRAIIYEKLDAYDKAIEDYTTAINLDPQCVQAYNNRGIIYDKLETYDKAYEDYTAAIMHDPNFATLYINRGSLYGTLEAYDKAIEDYTVAIDINAEYAEAYNNRGTIYSRIKIYDKAIEDYTSAIKLEPENGLFITNLGKMHFYKDNYDEAIKCLNMSITVDPVYSQAWYYLGKLYKLQNENHKAIKYYIRALYLGLDEGNEIVDCLNVVLSNNYYCPFLIKEYYNVPLQFTTTGEPLRVDGKIIQQADKMEQFITAISVSLPTSKSTLRTQAIINYHMGNPIQAYRIFDEKWDDDSKETQQDMFGQYYFFKSAQQFLENENTILTYALDSMKKKTDNGAALPLDYYYAALLCIEQKDYDCALKYLDHAMKDNDIILPALYTQLYCFHRNNMIAKEQEICRKILEMERNLLISRSGYLIDIHINKITFDPNNYISQLFHYCHYSETFNSHEILVEYLENTNSQSWHDLKSVLGKGRETLGDLWEFTDDFNAFLMEKNEKEKKEFIYSLGKYLKPDDPRTWKINPEWEKLESSAELACAIGSSFDEKTGKEKIDFSDYQKITLYYYCLGQLQTGDMLFLLFYFSIKKYENSILKVENVTIKVFLNLFCKFAAEFIAMLTVRHNPFVIASISIIVLFIELIPYFITTKALKNDLINLSYNSFSENFLKHIIKAEKDNPMLFDKQYKEIKKLFRDHTL
jgi:tetratricopeptide (TPR) repeat protein